MNPEPWSVRQAPDFIQALRQRVRYCVRATTREFVENNGSRHVLYPQTTPEGTWPTALALVARLSTVQGSSEARPASTRPTQTRTSLIMSAILFHGRIRDAERHKTINRVSPILGATIFETGFFRALLHYTASDPIYIVRELCNERADAGGTSVLDGFADRIKFVSANDLSPLTKVSELVLMSRGPHMFQFAWIRSRMGRAEWPIVGVTHSLLSTVFFPWFTSTLIGRLHEYDALVCSSHAARAAIQSAFDVIAREVTPEAALPFQLPVIPLGIEPGDFSTTGRTEARQRLGVKPDDVGILYFGRFSATDKCDLVPLLIAFSKLHTCATCRLILAGDDTEFRMADYLSKTATELGCGDRVLVVPDPDTDGKRDLLSAADVFVSPSDNIQETFGIAVAEAMCAGLPVVASDWSGYKDLVIQGETGFLVPSYLPALGRELELFGMQPHASNYQLLARCTTIDVESLCRYLELLADDPPLRQRLGTRGRKEAIRRFGWRQVIATYDELWASLLQRATQSKHQASPGPAGYPHKSVFGHYASRELLDTDIVALNEPSSSGQQCGHWRLAARDSGFSEELFTDLVAALRVAKSTSIGQLVDDLGRAEQIGDLVIRCHVGRLLKYGAIRLVTCPVLPQVG